MRKRLLLTLTAFGWLCSLSAQNESLVLTASRYCDPFFDEYTDFDFSPDGKLLAFGQDDGKVRIVDIEKKSEVFGETWHKKLAVTARFSKDGNYLVSCGRDGKINLIDLETKKLTKTVLAGEKAIRALEFSKEGDLLFTGGLEGILKIWSFPELELKHAYDIRSGNIHSIAPQTSKDLVWVGTSRALNGLCVVNSLNGQVKKTFLAGNIIDLALTTDESYLMAVSFDKDLFRVNTTSFSMDTQKKIHPKAVNNLKVVPGTPVFATAGKDKMVRFWNVHTLEEVYTIPEEKGVMNLGFSADHRWMVLTLSNGRIRVYDVSKLPFMSVD